MNLARPHFLFFSLDLFYSPEKFVCGQEPERFLWEAGNIFAVSVKIETTFTRGPFPAEASSSPRPDGVSNY